MCIRDSDKIINRANEQGRTAEEVATEFSDKFIGVMRAANVLDPDVRPRATKEIGAMIGMIKTLIEGGHAYAADNGDVYFLSLIHICPRGGSRGGGARCRAQGGHG